MRLLSYNVNSKLIKSLQNTKLYICDVAEDLDDALYHAQVRFYNLILIDEEEFLYCKKFLNVINLKTCAFIVLTDNKSKSFEIDVLNAGGLLVIQKPISLELLLAKIESIHRDNFIQRYHFKEYFIVDREHKQVVDLNDKELNIKGKSFEILSYLLKNRHLPVISKEEIIGVLWDEPEMVSNNIVEVNINLIRNEIRKRFNFDVISTIRNRGYKIINHT